MEAVSAEELAILLRQERHRQRDANHRQPSGMRACRALSDATDLMLQRLFALALPEHAEQRESVRRQMAVVATGGYGRRELCPHSDVDVTFVVAEEEDAALDATVRRMFHFVMELFTQRSGLKVGYAYRTLGDADSLDHQTQTSLLDSRVVVGSHPLGTQFATEVLRQIWPGAFIRQKVEERRRISEKHGGTLYRIEPEIREGPGGLRDMHLAEWLATVAFPTARGDVWRQLQRLGLVTREDAQGAAAARDFLLTVRNWMHWQTDRTSNILVRERQEHLAEALQFQDDDGASRVERFMEQYYAHAESIARVAGFVADRCLAERLNLTDELVCHGSELQAAFPWVEVHSPRFLVDLGRHFQEHGLLPGYELRRMIAQNLAACPELSGDAEAADDFLGLLRTQPGPVPVRAVLGGYAAPKSLRRETERPIVYETLALLAELGVLQRLIPELGVAYRRVPFDQVHRHTIGFHTLETVRALAELRYTEEDHLAELRRIVAEIDKPEVLYFAALLHDVGKVATANPGEQGAPGHSIAGAIMARDICERLQLEPQAAAKVVLLVEHHLLMSETAQLRDLTQDKTIQDFSAVIGSADLLSMLLLLTYSDMHATGVLSPMKVRFLLDLYFRAEPLVTTQGGMRSTAGGTVAGNPDRERRFRSRLSRQLTGPDLTPEQVRDHTEGMPVSYLLNSSPAQISLHIRMVETMRQQAQPMPVVEFDQELGTGVSTIHLCTLERPQPGLLSQIAGVLYAHDIAVHGAQVFTRTSPPAVALDALWVDYHGRAVPLPKRQELERDLIEALTHDSVEALIASRRRDLPRAIPPKRVALDNEAAEVHTVLEIEGDDQPGFLYRITRTLARLEWNIHSARITTVGGRARDAFYVTSPQGGKLLEDEPALVEAFLAEFVK